MAISLPPIPPDRAHPLVVGNRGLVPLETTLNQVRSKLTAAGFRAGKSWEELFRLCDKNQDGLLDSRELRHFIRDTLKVPWTTVSDHDLKMLLQHMDKDGNSTVDLSELLEYLQKGSVRPQDESLRRAKKQKRVRRNLRLAFADLSRSEAEVRRLFASRDLDHSGRISRYELHSFIREELDLTSWDVGDSDLNELYDHLDPNRDGIDIEEFWAYIKQAGKERRKIGTSDFLYGESPPPPKGGSAKRFKTYRQDLLENLPGLSKSTSLPVLSPTFSEQGRDRVPRTRMGHMCIR